MTVRPNHVAATLTLAVSLLATSLFISSSARAVENLPIAQAKLTFVGSKPDGKHTGGFNKVEGAVELDGSAPSKITLDIATSSIYSDDPRLTRHLQGPDFFDIRKFPKASFASTKIEATTGNDSATHTITGQLTIHGQTQTVAIPARVSVANGAVTIQGKVTIDRRKFGITYGEGKINPEVPIEFNLTASR